MCGRYTLSATPQRLADHFGLDSVPTAVPARYNIAPTQQVLIVRELPGDGRRLDAVRWGLIPSWSKDLSVGNRMINARVETLAQKPAFRAAFRRRRCLIPADGFYEWKATRHGKQPYWIGFEGRELFAFAGLWEHWDPPDGSGLLESCTIVTCDACRPVAQLHERMPVILPPSSYSAWLAPDNHDPALLAALLDAPCNADLTYYPISRRVNNPHNDDVDLLDSVQAQ